MATFLPNVTDKITDTALYTPNFSFLDTMLRRRQGMYDQGFAQVNSQYGALNRNMTHADNIQARDQYLQSAQKQLKDLSAMDLSQQQNVQSAVEVFQPFYKNKTLLADMALTAHYDQQENIAESLRLKDGGKEFSQDNLNYVRKQREQFRGDKADSVGMYLANKRSYNPYYNYSEEITKVMKDYKPNHYKYDRLNGYYKITEESTVAKEDDIRQYLDGVLSDKAKQQMRIEADVRLNNDPNALANIYTSIGDRELKMYDAAVSMIDKRLGQTKDGEEIKNLKALRDQKISEKDVINSRLSKIKQGDLSFIKSNAPELAYSIYYNNKMKEVSKALSYEDISQTIGQDEVRIAMMKEDRADARQASSQRHAEKMEMIKNGGLPGSFEINQLAIGADAAAVKRGFEDSQKEIEAYDKQIEAVTMQQKQYILAKAQERNPKLSIKDITPSFVSTWMKTGAANGGEISKKDMFYTYSNKLNELNALRDVPMNRVKSVEDKVLKDLSPADKAAVAEADRKIIAMGDIKLDDGTTISARDFLKSYNAGTLDVTQRISGGYMGGEGSENYEFKINGKTYKGSTRFNSRTGTSTGSNSALVGLYNAVLANQNKAGKAYTKYKDNVKDYFSKNFEPINMTTNVASFKDGSPQAKDLESSLSSVLPPGFNIKQRGVGTDANNQGKAYFFINTDKNSKLNESQAEGILTQAGYTVKKISQGDGGHVYEIGGLRSKVVNQFVNFTPIEGAIANSLSSHTGKDSFVSAPFSTPGSNTVFTVKKQNDLYYLNIPGQKDSYPSAFSDPTEAIMTARVLSANNDAGLKQYLQY